MAVEFWLRCKSCNRRGKYYANPRSVSYNQDKELVLLWKIKCKFCDKALSMDNLTESSISELYMFLIAKNLKIIHQSKSCFAGKHL